MESTALILFMPHELSMALPDVISFVAYVRFRLTFTYVLHITCRSLGHELSSSAKTLESWVRIPLEAFILCLS
jgi:hypothetical protein